MAIKQRAPLQKCSVRAHSVRPCNPAPPHNPPGGYRIRPYANQNLAPEGSIGEGQKSVKKSAALLRFLAFLFLDHPFGVPRGRAPWAGPPALSEVAGTFSVPFWCQKGTPCGKSPLKQAERRKVARSGSAKLAPTNLQTARTCAIVVPTPKKENRHAACYHAWGRDPF